MNIKQSDINLISRLEQYTYTKTMNGVVPVEEQEAFKQLKQRLKTLSDSYKTKYDDDAGPFLSEIATGNPISFHGKLRRVWSGIFKGSENKQYSAQISFVINPKENCLDVGFYFGRASSFNVDNLKRQKWEKELNELGEYLYNNINNDLKFKAVYESLFEYGFKAEIKGHRVSSDDWLQNLRIDPTHSSIIFNLKPDQNEEIEYSSIDLYVSMVLPLISILPERISQKGEHGKRRIKSLTPEQRAKQAERRALIGLDGEKYIMEMEKQKLSKLFVEKAGTYPIHKSIISDSFGYDILSLDNDGHEIFIEVKTTTLLREEPSSKIFYISSDEIEFFKKNKKSYRLYRVYDVYGQRSYEVLDLDKLSKSADNYRVVIP